MGTNQTKKDQVACQPEDWLTSNTYAVIAILCAGLVISLLLNVICCLSKTCPGKGRCQCRKKRSRSSTQMEDNPIYGNLSYTDESLVVNTEAAPLHPSVSSSYLRIPQRLNCDSQSKHQECYANLTLKAPRPQSGRISPQIQVSDIVHVEEPVEPEEGPDETETEDPVSIDDAVSTTSGLYASVQTQRAKMVDSVDSEEGYANHL